MKTNQTNLFAVPRHLPMRIRSLRAVETASSWVHLTPSRRRNILHRQWRRKAREGQGRRVSRRTHCRNESSGRHQRYHLVARRNEPREGENIHCQSRKNHFTSSCFVFNKVRPNMLEALASLIRVADNKTVSDALRSIGAHIFSASEKLLLAEAFLDDVTYPHLELMTGLQILPTLAGNRQLLNLRSTDHNACFCFRNMGKN